jgi:F0F1-type ATP synthase alpha subunit
LRYLETSRQDVEQAIEKDKDLTEEVEKNLKEALTEFNATFFTGEKISDQ